MLWKWQFLRAWLVDVSPDSGSNLPTYIFAGCAAMVWYLTEEVFLGGRE